MLPVLRSSTAEGGNAEGSGTSRMKYFTETAILRQIGHRRLAKLLAGFDQDLKACKLVLSEPDPKSEDYFADLANALATQRLPDSLRKTLLTIENAASPENDKPLWVAIKRRIPGVSVSEDCAVDRALDLWFLAPDEMTQFAPRQTNGEEGNAEVNRRGANDTEKEERAAASSTPSLHHSSTPIPQVTSASSDGHAAGEAGVARESAMPENISVHPCPSVVPSPFPTNRP